MKNNNNAVVVFISGSKISCNENGLYSLNDLHKASGGEKRHEPNRWLRSAEVKEVIEEMEKSDTHIWVTKRGGKGQGTFVNEILFSMYASWISPKMHIRVYEIFTQTIKERAAALEKENEELNDFRDGFYRMELANNMLAKDYSKLDQDTIKGIKMVIRKLKFNKELSIYDLISMPLIQRKAADRALEYVLRNVVTCLNPDYPRERQVFVAKQ